MNRPNKHDRLDRFDDLILSALASAGDAAGVIALRPGEASAVLMRQGIALPPADAEQAIARLFAAQRIAVGSEHVRILPAPAPRAERTTALRQLFAPNMMRSALWADASVATRRVWLELLMQCDADGSCAQLSRGELYYDVSEVEVEAALEFLLAAGRIERRPNGGIVLRNHARYRDARPRPRVTIGVPADWQPNESHAEFATRFALDLEREVDSFRAYAQQPQPAAGLWDREFARWLDHSRRLEAAEQDNDGTAKKGQGKTGRGD